MLRLAPILRVLSARVAASPWLLGGDEAWEVLPEYSFGCCIYPFRLAFILMAGIAVWSRKQQFQSPPNRYTTEAKVLFTREKRTKETYWGFLKEGIPPKWTVYFIEHPSMDDWGVPWFSGNLHMEASRNRATAKLSMLIGFSLINHPFWSSLIMEPPTSHSLKSRLCCRQPCGRSRLIRWTLRSRCRSKGSTRTLWNQFLGPCSRWSPVTRSGWSDV